MAKTQNGLLEADYIVIEMASRSWARTGCASTWTVPMPVALNALV